jgi:hypothetical protein
MKTNIKNYIKSTESTSARLFSSKTGACFFGGGGGPWGRSYKDDRLIPHL